VTVNRHRTLTVAKTLEHVPECSPFEANLTSPISFRSSSDCRAPTSLVGMVVIAGSELRLTQVDFYPNGPKSTDSRVVTGKMASALQTVPVKSIHSVMSGRIPTLLVEGRIGASNTGGMQAAVARVFGFPRLAALLFRRLLGISPGTSFTGYWSPTKKARTPWC
jgi:hypothetical protein